VRAPEARKLLEGYLKRDTMNMVAFAELPLITNAEGAASLPLDDWQVQTDEAFAERVGEVLSLDSSARSANLRSHVIKLHSINALVSKIIGLYHS
jgi:hypothetical protein